jgi:hypothetical protein
MLGLGSILVRGMYVCCVYSVFLLSCVGRALITAQGLLLILFYDYETVKQRQNFFMDWSAQRLLFLCFFIFLFFAY